MAGTAQQVGPFTWQNGFWQQNLPTDALGTGCWRLDAGVDGGSVATAVIQLQADSRVSASLRRH